MLAFEWDETKNKTNRLKHGIWFEEARTVFDDPNGRLFFDKDNSATEARFILLGYSSSNRLLVVPHSYRKGDQVVRIISARKATPKERQYYEERV